MLISPARRMLWIALLAAWCGAVLPAATSLLTALRGERVELVCTSSGIKRLGINSAGTQSPLLAEGECTYCQCAEGLAILDLPLAAPPDFSGSALPSLSPALTTIHTGFRWQPSQPRPPPSLA